MGYEKELLHINSLFFHFVMDYMYVLYFFNLLGSVVGRCVQW